MNNLELVKSKVITAVPEIMELKFGCRIYIETGEILKDIGTYVCDLADGSYLMHSDEQFRFHGRISYDMILGRPITLADVLRTIHKYPCSLATSIDTEGRISIFGTEVRRTLWDLTKDLDGQSEETINFLAELLK